MKKLDIYLETSIFNFVFADDAPDKRDDTLILFDEIRTGKHNVFTSMATVEELGKANEPKQTQMMDLITEYSIRVVQLTENSELLAEKYIQEGMIPVKYRDDAVHIAIASVSGADVIVSWNFKHIVKLKTKLLTEEINVREGYKSIEIYSPTEVIENENE